MQLELSEIQPLRKRLGVTQAELANLSGVSQSLIAKIESGKIDPTYSKAEKIFSSLNKLSRKEEKKVSELMYSKLIFVFDDSNIEESTKLMRQHGISQLPVLDREKKAIGYISENRLLEALFKDRSKDTKVREIMMECPPIITEDSSLHVALALLKYYPLALVNKAGKLKGIITKSDIITNMYV